MTMMMIREKSFATARIAAAGPSGSRPEEPSIAFARHQCVESPASCLVTEVGIA